MKREDILTNSLKNWNVLQTIQQYCKQYNKMIKTIYKTNPGVIYKCVCKYDEISNIIYNN